MMSVFNASAFTHIEVALVTIDSFTMNASTLTALPFKAGGA